MKEANEFPCENCGLVLGTVLEQRSEVYPVRGEDVTIQATVRLCSRCQTDTYDRELDEQNLAMAYERYRQTHSIIGPDEIRSIRADYGLSQRSLGALLGWGEVTIHRYESGSLPDESHSQVLRLIQEPSNMELMFKQYSGRLNENARRKLAGRLADISTRQASETALETLNRVASHKQSNVLTGHREFSPSVLMDMMTFFAAKPGGVLKTKLNKLLWYSDFIHFKHHSASISGATYVHLPYGPVPDDYEFYLYSLCSNGLLSISEKDFGDFVGENIAAVRRPMSHTLPLSALDVLDAVYVRFRGWSSKQISAASHQEEGYLKTERGDAISYEYALSLRVDIPTTNHEGGAENEY